MTVSFCGLQLAHPIINGSGTFDALAARRVFGDELDAAFPFSAFVSKTITAQPRDGNPPPRLWETAAGMVNSIGLPNKGLANYLAADLPELARLPVPIITNVMGNTGEEVRDLVAAVAARPEVAAIELNVSCPNVKTGLDIGADPAVLVAFMRTVRPATGKPLIVKLTPNTSDVAACAAAAEDGGADAVAHQHAPRLRSPPGRLRRPVARWRDGRHVRSGRPNGRAGPGPGRRRAGERADRGHGGRVEPPTRRGSAARRRNPRRGGDRELPRPPRSGADRRGPRRNRRKRAGFASLTLGRGNSPAGKPLEMGMKPSTTVKNAQPQVDVKANSGV